MPGKASPSPKREQEYRSRSSRAGLTFPVSRIHRYLRRAYPKQRIGAPPRSTLVRTQALIAVSSQRPTVIPSASSRNLSHPRMTRYERLIELIPAAAALEYLIAELVEIAGTQCRDAGRRLIKPRHIRLAISSDQELSDLIGKAVIKEGGVQPHIESALLPKKKKTTSQDTDSTTQAGSKGKKAIKTPKQTAPKTRKSSEKKPTVVEVEDDDEDYSLQVI